MELDSGSTSDIPMLVALIILCIGLYFRGLVLWISLALAILYLYIFDRESIVTLVIYGFTASLLIAGYLRIRTGLNLAKGSYGKVMVADFVISLSRKVQDKLAGTGRWHVIKNRFGPDGITLPSKMNTSNGQFNIYTDTSLQGQNTQKQMDNGNEMARKMLARKYQETQNDGFE